MSTQPKKEEVSPPLKADPSRLAEAKKLPKVEIEKVKHVGPCGEDNPCGGGFGKN